MTNVDEIGRKAKKLEKTLSELTGLHEEAVAVCAVTQSLLTRQGAQYNVLKGSHIQEEGAEGGRQ